MNAVSYEFTGTPPVDLSLAKTHLRVLGSDDDDYINLLIDAAIDYVVKYARIFPYEADVTENCYIRNGQAIITCSPVDTSTIDYDGNNVTARMRGSVIFIDISDYYEEGDTAQVTYTAGIEDITANVTLAILKLVGDMYEKRTNTIEKLPTAVDRLLKQDRQWA